jgi:hypothetical protein
MDKRYAENLSSVAQGEKFIDEENKKIGRKNEAEGKKYFSIIPLVLTKFAGDIYVSIYMAAIF